MIPSLLSVLGTGLSIWDSSRRNQYKKELDKIEDEIRKINSMTYEKMDHLRLDELEHRLNQLALRWSDEVNQK